MFYSSYNYILPSEQKDEQILRTSYSQLLKTPYKAPHNTATQDLSNTILYALEKNVYDMSEISNMLQSLLSSLCTDTNSDFFGLFPYFLSMTPDDYIKPDYSFQPLVLLPLLECYIDFSHRFSPELMLRLSEVLTMSTNILSYTSNYIDSHTKLLEIILMVCVGEHFSIPQFIRSAKNKTTKYYHFIKYNGDMPLEYNSPEHIVLQLEAILHFSSYITDEDLKRILNEIKDILLSIFYRHFNPFLLQWTGPFSIKHSTFIKDDFLETIKNVIKQDDLEQLTVPKKFYNISL